MISWVRPLLIGHRFVPMHIHRITIGRVSTMDIYGTTSVMRRISFVAIRIGWTHVLRARLHTRRRVLLRALTHFERAWMDPSATA